MTVQFWVALDGYDRITINNALRGKEYQCLECNGIMIPKKGEIKQHHFAHKSDYSCSGEGQKHLYIKELIFEILQLDEYLLNGAKIYMEKSFLGLRPDILIKWNKDRYVAIEVCDTSESSKDKKKIYGKNMIEFKISDWKEEEMTNPIYIFNSVYPILFRKIFNITFEEKQRKLKELNLEYNKLLSEYKQAQLIFNKNFSYIDGSWGDLSRIQDCPPRTYVATTDWFDDKQTNKIAKLTSKSGKITWVKLIEFLGEDDYRDYYSYEKMEISEESKSILHKQYNYNKVWDESDWEEFE